MSALRCWKPLAPAALAAGLLAASLRAAHCAPPAAPPERAIGIEGRTAVELPRDDYRPRPLDDRTELILRIASVVPATNGLHRYEFYHMGLEPGRYALADYLVRPDGSRPDELSNAFLQVRAVLPDDHDGALTPHAPERFPFIGGYRAFLAALALLWAGGIAAFVFAGRRKPPPAPAAPPAPEPTFAERIRPLVEAAASGSLSSEEKAVLERLLMGFWRERLGTSELPMAASLAQLKAHPEAGELLRALERWLHARAGASPEEVTRMLKPYGRPPEGPA